MNINVCAAMASVGTTIAVPTGVCPGPGSAITSIAQATFPDILTTTDKTGPPGAVKTVTREMLLLAPMIQLNFRSSDLAAAPSPPTTAAPTTTDPATGTNPDADTDADADADSNSDANADSNSGSDANRSDANGSGSDASSAGSANNNDSAGGLSTGAVAGVGVGAALGGILLAAVVGWLWWRRARRARFGSEVASTAAETVPGRHEADNTRGAWQGHKPEAPYYHYPQDAGRHSTPPVELESQSAAAELSAVSSVPSYARWTSRR